MNTNSFYTIGSSHKVCQDYCWHENNLAIVSDGCSSSKNTDVGARLLVHAKLTCKDEGEAIRKADAIRRLLDLDETCLDATLITLKFNGNVIESQIHGDGVRILLMEDGEILYETFAFTDNKPEYLSYDLNSQRLDQYYKELGKIQVKRTTVYLKTGKTVVEEFKTKTPETMGNSFSVSNISPEQYNLKAVIIATDGLESFIKNGEPLPLQTVIKELTNIKSWKGPFIERKVKRMIVNFHKEGYEHYDDIGVAGIYLGD